MTTVTNQKTIIKGLNPQQKEAVLRSYKQPTLVIAGAGSGKTTVLTRRVNYILYKGVDPRRLLTVTFTNKAAKEMKERIEVAVGKKKASRILIGTFHSLCVRWLHQYYAEAGLKKSWTIYDDEDINKIFKNILKNHGLTTDKQTINLYKSRISNLKNAMVLPKDFRLTMQSHEQMIYNVYQDYVLTLQRHNAVDFDDLILRMVILLQNDPIIRKKFQSRYNYVMCDEYQDTNECQYLLINLIVGKDNNIFVVGDDYQCWDQDTLINTTDGLKRAIDLKKGDMVQTSEQGKITFAEATGVNVIDTAPMLEITTESGKVIKVTPNHKCYATMPDFKDDHYYVYLMYRKDKGYRIGLLSGGLSGTIGSRSFSERPERLWLLGRYSTKKEASYVESRLSLAYQIPKNPFFHNGRGLVLEQESLDKLFNEFGKNGEKLLEDMGFLFDYPHHVPQGTSRHTTQNRIINIMTNVKGVNQISLEYDDVRIRKWNASYKNIYQLSQTLQEQHQADFVRERFSMGKGNALQLYTANSLLPSMQIPVLQNDGLVLESIVSIKDAGTGTVVDIEVERTGVVIGNDILTHNSIYGWRGADVQKILNFQHDYPGTKIIKLEQNYRSTQNIVNAGNELMNNNQHQMSKVCFSDHEEGEKIKVVKSPDDETEARFIAEEIRNLVTFNNYDYKDVAILYRTNVQSRLLEDQFIRHHIPYEMISGFSFYSRKEIKDILAWLQLAVNPDNDIACERITAMQKGVGATTIKEIKNKQRTSDKSMYELIELSSPSRVAIAAAFSAMTNIVARLNALHEAGKAVSDTPISDMFELIFKYTGYIDQLRETGKEEEFRRIDNLLELQKIAKGYEEEAKKPTIQDFLDQIALQSKVDNVTDDDKVQMMTLHTSKGLEYPIVFLIGLEEGLFPHANSSDDVSIEEERRLCYVGITRAQKLLYMTWAQKRMDWQRNWSWQSISRFIDEVPQTLRESL